MNDTVLVGIVSYNPDLERLKLNLEAVCEQVMDVLIIDNGSDNIDCLEKLIKYSDKISLIKNKKNMGIAAALNQIGDYAIKNSKVAFLTLDQDSIISKDLIQKLCVLLSDKKVGIACPYIDRYNDFKEQYILNKVKTAITSGSLVRTSAWQAVGGFWEFLFIDEVDHEFSYQIRRKKYWIVQTQEVAIDHIIGTPFKKKILGHVFHPTNHSAFRRYYIARNDVIMQYLYPEEKEPFAHRYKMLYKIIISIVLCEKDKIKKTCAVLGGIIDAIKWIVKNKEIKERRDVKSV